VGRNGICRSSQSKITLAKTIRLHSTKLTATIQLR
jgi:hypothetical protein